MTQFILNFIAGGGYWGIAFLMALENIVPPIPSEVIMGFGGIAVSNGRMAFWPLLIAGTVGSVVGNLGWYGVGRWLGHDRLRPIVDRWGRWMTIEWRDIERAGDLFERHGGKLVFIFRVLPTFRTMISLPAGMLKMPAWRFIAATTLGTGTWNAVLIAAGYWLGTRFDRLEQWTGPAAIALFVAIVIGYIYRVATWSPRG